MSVGSLTVLLFAAVAFQGNAADDAKAEKKAYEAVLDSAVLVAQRRRAWASSEQMLKLIAGRLEKGDDDGKKLAPAIRTLLKLASDRDVDGKLADLIRTLTTKNAHRNLDTLNVVLRDCRTLSADLKALRRAAEKCRPQLDASAVRGELAAARAALEQDGGKVGNELKAALAKLLSNEPRDCDLRELFDRVLVAQRGRGKSPSGGGGEGKRGQDTSGNEYKVGGKAGRVKESPLGPCLSRSKGKSRADLAAPIDELTAFRRALRNVAGRLKGNTQAVCDDLIRRLTVVHKLTCDQVELDDRLDAVASIEEVVGEIQRLVKIVRDDLISELDKN
jgi:hypothetical protein